MSTTTPSFPIDLELGTVLHQVAAGGSVDTLLAGVGGRGEGGQVAGAWCWPIRVSGRPVGARAVVGRTVEAGGITNR